MIDRYWWLTRDAADPGRVGAERRRQRVDLRAPGDRGEGAEDGAEPDRQHDDGELRLADARGAGPAASSSGAEQRRRRRTASAKRHPVVEPAPDDDHVADEGAQHQEVALGEVDQLGRLVDQDEAERDQAVDAADGQAVQYQLKDGVQGVPLSLRSGQVIARGTPRRQLGSKTARAPAHRLPRKSRRDVKYAAVHRMGGRTRPGSAYASGTFTATSNFV